MIMANSNLVSYIGTKTVTAEQMTKGDAISNGIIKPIEDENGNVTLFSDAEIDAAKLINGYRVLHADSTESWIEKSSFERSFKVSTDLSIGDIIMALNNGKLASRNSWTNGDYLVKQISSVITPDIIPKLNSLPISVKNRLISNNSSITYGTQVLIINDNGEADSWVPSLNDLFATDWQIFE